MVLAESQTLVFLPLLKEARQAATEPFLRSSDHKRELVEEVEAIFSFRLGKPRLPSQGGLGFWI